MAFINILFTTSTTKNIVLIFVTRQNRSFDKLTALHVHYANFFLLLKLYDSALRKSRFFVHLYVYGSVRCQPHFFSYTLIQLCIIPISFFSYTYAFRSVLRLCIIPISFFSYTYGSV